MGLLEFLFGKKQPSSDQIALEGPTADAEAVESAEAVENTESAENAAEENAAEADAAESEDAEAVEDAEASDDAEEEADEEDDAEEDLPANDDDDDEPMGRTIEIDPVHQIMTKAEELGVDVPDVALIKAKKKEEKAEAKAKAPKEKKQKSLYDWIEPKKKKKVRRPDTTKKVVMLGDLIIGDGDPKICVPVMGATVEEIVASTRAAAVTYPDLLEWRADFFEEIETPERAEEALKALKAEAEDLPILFTFRNKREGGNRDLEAEAYRSVVLWAAAQADIDMIDVEALDPTQDSEILILDVHRLEKPVIGSRHYFDRMPKKPELEMDLDRIERTGADILKLAVMPKKPKDVLKLMTVTSEKNELTTCPIVTMAMGDLGKLSRISGSLTGSAITFGSAGEASAPGQIQVELLRAFLNELD